MLAARPAELGSSGAGAGIGSQTPRGRAPARPLPADDRSSGARAGRRTLRRHHRDRRRRHLVRPGRRDLADPVLQQPPETSLDHGRLRFRVRFPARHSRRRHPPPGRPIVRLAAGGPGQDRRVRRVPLVVLVRPAARVRVRRREPATADRLAGVADSPRSWRHQPGRSRVAGLPDRRPGRRQGGPSADHGDRRGAARRHPGRGRHRGPQAGPAHPAARGGHPHARRRAGAVPAHRRLQRRTHAGSARADRPGTGRARRLPRLPAPWRQQGPGAARRRRGRHRHGEHRGRRVPVGNPGHRPGLPGVSHLGADSGWYGGVPGVLRVLGLAHRAARRGGGRRADLPRVLLQRHRRGDPAAPHRRGDRPRGRGRRLHHQRRMGGPVPGVQRAAHHRLVHRAQERGGAVRLYLERPGPRRRRVDEPLRRRRGHREPGPRA